MGRRLVGSSYVNVKSFQEALVRAVFVASALELMRPFLSPLFAFSCSGPKGEMRTVPSCVASFLLFLAERYSRCSAEVELEPRVDTQASDTRTGVAGWLPASKQDGSKDTASSLWFSEEIGSDQFPWSVCKERDSLSRRGERWLLYSPSERSLRQPEKGGLAGGYAYQRRTKDGTERF